MACVLILPRPLFLVVPLFLVPAVPEGFLLMVPLAAVLGVLPKVGLAAFPDVVPVGLRALEVGPFS